MASDSLLKVIAGLVKREGLIRREDAKKAKEALKAEAEDDEEEDESIPLTDDVWKVPQLASVGGSQIRFAEDIMVSRAPEGRRRGRGRGGGMEDSRKARKAAAKRSSKQAGGGTPAP